MGPRLRLSSFKFALSARLSLLFPSVLLSSKKKLCKWLPWSWSLGDFLDWLKLYTPRTLYTHRPKGVKTGKNWIWCKAETPFSLCEQACHVSFWLSVQQLLSSVSIIASHAYTRTNCGPNANWWCSIQQRNTFAVVSFQRFITSVSHQSKFGVLKYVSCSLQPSSSCSHGSSIVSLKSS